MHKINRNRQTAVLRFRRWSRAAYATFMSLGRVVTIGKLPSDIEEKSMCKSIEISKVDTTETQQSETVECCEQESMECALMVCAVVSACDECEISEDKFMLYGTLL